MSKLKAISVIFALVVLICCISTVTAAEVDDRSSVNQTDSSTISCCTENEYQVMVGLPCPRDPRCEPIHLIHIL